MLHVLYFLFLFTFRCDIATDVVVLHIDKLSIEDSSIILTDVTSGSQISWSNWEDDVPRQMFKVTW